MPSVVRRVFIMADGNPTCSTGQTGKGAARRRREQRLRADARRVTWLVACCKAASSHHSGDAVLTSSCSSATGSGRGDSSLKDEVLQLRSDLDVLRGWIERQLGLSPPVPLVQEEVSVTVPQVQCMDMDQDAPAVIRTMSPRVPPRVPVQKTVEAPQVQHKKCKEVRLHHDLKVPSHTCVSKPPVPALPVGAQASVKKQEKAEDNNIAHCAGGGDRYKYPIGYFPVDRSFQAGDRVRCSFGNGSVLHVIGKSMVNVALDCSSMPVYVEYGDVSWELGGNCI